MTVHAFRESATAIVPYIFPKAVEYAQRSGKMNYNLKALENDGKVYLTNF